MYATQADLDQRFGTAELVKLTDRATPGTGQIDATVIARALADAEAEVNGYLQGRYTLPLATVPAVLVRVTCDIARYYLYDDWATDQVRDRYKDSVALLKGIADGKVSLGLDQAAAQIKDSSGSKVSENCPERIFSRDKLEGF